eukprot:Gb_21556 [translate_table: standard]
MYFSRNYVLSSVECMLLLLINKYHLNSIASKICFGRTQIHLNGRLRPLE